MFFLVSFHTVPTFQRYSEPLNLLWQHFGCRQAHGQQQRGQTVHVLERAARVRQGSAWKMGAEVGTGTGPNDICYLFNGSIYICVYIVLYI